MRKQIAAANWKMNCTLEEAKLLLEQMSDQGAGPAENQEVIVAVPFPYLLLAKEFFEKKSGYHIAAQNCSSKESGAYTGEVSAAMIASCGVQYVIIGHSERREYFRETHDELTEKVKQALSHGLTPVFCCGEPLQVRESNEQNHFVAMQLQESLFGLDAGQFARIIIAYEPIWAIGTGKTASSDQAQEMHAFIRQTIAGKYGQDLASDVSILYGGSVKGDNAQEIFQKPDVDGGLVGGASLKAGEFDAIVRALKR